LTNTKKLARNHEVEVAPQSGLISIMGGKWTTYRSMAQDAIDAVQEYLNAPVSKCPTIDHPLAGSEGFSPDYWQSLQKLDAGPEAAARQLAQKFGTRASNVMELARVNPQPVGPLSDGEARLRAEVLFTIRTEMAVSMEDILARRLGIQFRRWRAAIQVAPAVAEILASELGWSEMKRQEALVQYVSKIRGMMQEAGLAREGVDRAHQSSAEA
jgi:glycerol-3-phosphate dehydrogenase